MIMLKRLTSPYTKLRSYVSSLTNRQLQVRIAMLLACLIVLGIIFPSFAVWMILSSMVCVFLVAFWFIIGMVVEMARDDF